MTETERKGLASDEVELLNDGRVSVVAYTEEYRGESYFHIRRRYRDAAGDWQPGKGLAVPTRLRAELLAKLSAL